jgi:signal transduction histidine kinase
MPASPEPVIVFADGPRLRQVIDNLIGNALRHTPPGTAVTVTVDATPDHGQLLVTDNGPGMTAEQASRVFERFYRTDHTRSRARGGTGLGLSIAAAVVDAHRGDHHRRHPARTWRHVPGPATARDGVISCGGANASWSAIRRYVIGLTA